MVVWTRCSPDWRIFSVVAKCICISASAICIFPAITAQNVHVFRASHSIIAHISITDSRTSVQRICSSCIHWSRWSAFHEKHHSTKNHKPLIPSHVCVCWNGTVDMQCIAILLLDIKSDAPTVICFIDLFVCYSHSAICARWPFSFFLALLNSVVGGFN